MKKIAIASILTLFCAFTCALVAGTVTAQEGWEKTVTLPSGEKVLDMRGEWDILYEFYGPLDMLAPCTDILLITQQGATFSAVKQIGTRWQPKGVESIKGELDKDGFKAVQVYRGAPEEEMGTFIWVPCKGEISENGNKVVFDDGDRIKWTISRK